MNISYGEPLSKGWNRMKNALFKPFDLGKWFVLGFTAFLAGLLDGSGGSGGSYRSKDRDWNFESLGDFISSAKEWLENNPFWSALIIFGILLLIALVVLLTWLSSRGKFMFLDNVVHERALVTKPWKQFKTLGNSLFVWRICFFIISLPVFGLFIFAGISIGLYIHNNGFSGLVTGLIIAGMVLLFILLSLFAAYISLFLSHFIVPIMYKNNIGAVQAWRRFIPLLTGHLLHFILYGIIILLLNILVFICIVIIGLFTCCIGFIILSIPYIGTVVMLPVKFTFRAMSVEFLEQFGSEHEIFPKPDDNEFDGVYEF